MAVTALSGVSALPQRLAARRASRAGLRSAVSNGSRTVMAADRPVWLPGSPPAPHLAGLDIPGNFGFDPLGLGANEEGLTWFREAERVHARWAMLGCAGVLVQEIVRPDVFFYTAPTTIDLPFSLPGLIAFQLFTMHWTELRRIQDIRKPGSVDQDPIFSQHKLPEHEPGYPGGVFAPFIPGDLATLKEKEIKNGRLAMLGFVGFLMAAQTTGKNPLAALSEHLADPLNNNMFGKAVVAPGTNIPPPCALDATATIGNFTFPTPCFWWP